MDQPQCFLNPGPLPPPSPSLPPFPPSSAPLPHGITVDNVQDLLVAVQNETVQSIVLARRGSPYVLNNSLMLARDIALTGEDADIELHMTAMDSSVLHISGNATLIGLRITGGSVRDTAIGGGGVFIGADGWLTMLACSVSGNVAPFGAGIFNYRGTAWVINSTISGNIGTRAGTAVFTDRGVTILTGTLLAGTIDTNCASGAVRVERCANMYVLPAPRGYYLPGLSQTCNTDMCHTPLLDMEPCKQQSCLYHDILSSQIIMQLPQHYDTHPGTLPVACPAGMW
eukprot:4851593-Prymnesium_polylepis.2